MKIMVTPGDIRNGKKASCSQCPVALALTARFPSRTGIVVDYNRADIKFSENPGGWIPFNLSQRVTRFIRNFDEGKPVKPFTFEI